MVQERGRTLAKPDRRGPAEVGQSVYVGSKTGDPWRIKLGGPRLAMTFPRPRPEPRQEGAARRGGVQRGP